MDDRRGTAAPRRASRVLLVLLGVLLLGMAFAGREGVLITDIGQFMPGNLTITPGTVVVWKNMGVLSQIVSCDPAWAKEAKNPYVKLPSGAAPWDSGPIYPGDMWSHTFTTPGVYVYVNRGAPGGAVVGVITVTKKK